MYLLQIVWDPASDGITLFGNFKIHYYSLMWMAAFITGCEKLSRWAPLAKLAIIAMIGIVFKSLNLFIVNLYALIFTPML